MSRRSGGSQRQQGPSTSAAPSSQDADSTDPALMAIRFGMKNTLELVEDLIPACPTEADKQRVTQRLKAIMLKFVKAEKSYHESNNFINEAVQQEFPDEETLDDKEIFGSCAQILPIAEAKMKEYEGSLRDNSLKTHPMYIKLLDEIREYGESPDLLEESVMADDGGNEHIPVIDPITKTKLTDPVRNSKCKHIYGHASILQLIKKNSKFRCPTMGCPNNTFIKARDLVSDPKLTELVRKKQEEAEQQSEDDS